MYTNNKIHSLYSKLSPSLSHYVIIVLILIFITPCLTSAFNVKKQNSGYKEAYKYFMNKKVIKHHFFNFGFALQPLKSFSAFEINTKDIFSFHAHYRSQQLSPFKVISAVLALEYQYHKTLSDHHLSLLVGGRYPTSSDLKRFHTDFLLGATYIFNKKKWIPPSVPIEARLLFTHIISPKDYRSRVYFQWGFPFQANYLFAQEKYMIIGLSLRLGVDFHL